MAPHCICITRPQWVKVLLIMLIIDIPDICQMIYGIIMIADGLAPNRCQAISTHHADLTVTVSWEEYIMWHDVYHIITIQAARIKRVHYNAINPPVSLLWMGPYFHGNDTLSQSFIMDSVALMSVFDHQTLVTKSADSAGNLPLQFMYCFAPKYVIKSHKISVAIFFRTPVHPFRMSKSYILVERTYVYNVIFFEKIFIISADFNARAYAATMLITLTHCGLVMQYDEVDLGHYWLR